MEEASRQTFRITFWRPWLLAVTPSALLAAVGIVITLAIGQLAAASTILLGLAVFAVALLIVIGLSVRAISWHVDAKGIGGRNNMLTYNYLNWAEIDSVEPGLIPGYPYLQVNGGGKRRAFWLPLFLTDMPGLRATLAQYASPENPGSSGLAGNTTICRGTPGAEPAVALHIKGESLEQAHHVP